MLTDEQTDALIETVRAVAKAEILPHFRNLGALEIDSKSAPDDLVTIADRAAELAISKAVHDILPDAAIVGEEAVSADKSVLARVKEPGTVVIIDPIDGTWNYANGVATYGVILAVIEDGETVFGLLYDPSYDDWIMARKGQGALFCRADGRREPMQLAPPPDALSDCFGFVGMYLFNAERQAQLAATLPKFRRTQTLRCSCHEYRLLTQGASQFCLNGMLNVWDHAAGVLIYQEAGGVARLLDGRSYSPAMRKGHLLTAASEPLWEQLSELFGDE
ncbi:inositol monophosphatase family protein [uncultured Litoreibacter sp.]|uniref:inositol monophosphatase family protein n=1 Tax=uncultured Litoreibacter sp. TaxID=1392394 RepID=UPI002603DCAD|nr:inositol monophosphatase family protein [uncultured Litoreibacter sp.]